MEVVKKSSIFEIEIVLKVKGKKKYNRYGRSLRKNKAFNLKCKHIKSISKTVDLNTEILRGVSL